MAYPKPLSQKSLERLYKQSGISEKQMEFIRTFVKACANLYGAFAAWEAWEVYKILAKKTKVIKIQRRNLYDMLAIMRREPDNTFYVFEIDEVYSAERRRQNDMLVVLKEIIGTGHEKFDDLYVLFDNSSEKPFFIPENLLEYVEMPENIYETELLFTLGLLKSTRKMVPVPYCKGKMKKCLYTGKRLKDFSYVSHEDEFRMEWEMGVESCGKKPNPKKLAEIKDKIYSVNAAQRIVNELKWDSNIGADSIVQTLGRVMEYLDDMGVDVDDLKKMNQILRLIENMHNHQHLWANHGWTPSELCDYSGPARKPMVSIGPGLRQAFKDGVIDEEEYKKAVREAGFGIIGED